MSKTTPPIELELLAIVVAMKRFDQYGFGNPNVTIHTDLESLIPIFNKFLLKAPKKLQAMLLALQRYPAKVIYKPGAQQITTDMLSRAPTDKATNNEIPEGQFFQIESFLSDLNINDPLQNLPVLDKTCGDIKDMTRADPEIQAVKNLILQGWHHKQTEIPSYLRPYFHLRDQLTVLDGVIYKGSQLVIPATY